MLTLNQLKEGDHIWEYRNYRVYCGTLVNIDYRLHGDILLNFIGLDWKTWLLSKEGQKKMNTPLYIADNGDIDATSFKALMIYLIKHKKKIHKIIGYDFSPQNKLRISQTIRKNSHV